MAEDKQPTRRGAFDEDGALHISGIDVIASLTRSDWKGASFAGLPEDDAAAGVRRAHITCPHCASQNPADAEACWNCAAAL